MYIIDSIEITIEETEPSGNIFFCPMLCIIKKLSRILQSVFRKQELKENSDV